MRAHHSLRDWFLAKDPALSRLRLALRVTLTIALSAGVLAAFSLLFHPLPPIAFGLGVALAVQGGLTVRDASLPDQFVTRVLGALASLAAVGLAAVLEEHRIISDLAFLAVIFAASYARAFGTRWMAVGMFAFMSYFMGAYFRPSVEELPLVALGAATAVAVSQAVRAYILPDNPHRDVVRALESILQRINRILAHLSALDGTPPQSARGRRNLLRLEETLKETVLMTEGLLGDLSDEDISSEPSAAGRLALTLYDLHLAAESTIMLSLRRPPPRRLIAAAQARPRKKADDIIVTDPDGDPALNETIAALAWLRDARRELRGETIRVKATGLPPVSKPRRQAAKPARRGSLLSLSDPALRTAIQITLASAIAMVFGLMLSRDRWFWAVLSAFLVFTNTRSRGDTAVKAAQRIGGTLLGIAAGIGLAALLAGHPVVVGILATVFVFLAFHVLTVSYTGMTFFMSIVIALVYSMMGVVTVDLLRLRIEETLIGAAAGAGVAFLVFPTRTRGALDGATDAWFAALKSLLHALKAGEAGLPLVARSQALDRAYSELRVAARPVGVSWQVVRRPGHVRQTLAIFMAATYWGRLLARKGGTGLDAAGGGALLEEALRSLDGARRKRADCFYAARRTPVRQRAHLPISRKDPRLGLEMIPTLLERLYPAQPAGPGIVHAGTHVETPAGAK